MVYGESNVIRRMVGVLKEKFGCHRDYDIMGHELRPTAFKG